MQEVWAFWYYVQWEYLHAAKLPWNYGWVHMIPAAGLVGLATGLVIGFFKKARELLIFLVPLLIAQILIICAIIYRDKVTGTALNVTIGTFLIVELFFVASCLYRARSHLLVALCLCLFIVSYALAVSFFAGMSFSGVWL